MKSKSPNNPISPDRHPNLHGNPNAVPVAALEAAIPPLAINRPCQTDGAGCTEASPPGRGRSRGWSGCGSSCASESTPYDSSQRPLTKIIRDGFSLSAWLFAALFGSVERDRIRLVHDVGRRAISSSTASSSGARLCCTVRQTYSSATLS
jgi:hypothetical protein